MAESVCAHCGGGVCACVGVGVGVVLERLIDNVIMIIHNKDQTSYHIELNWPILLIECFLLRWNERKWIDEKMTLRTKGGSNRILLKVELIKNPVVASQIFLEITFLNLEWVFRMNYQMIITKLVELFKCDNV